MWGAGIKDGQLTDSAKKIVVRRCKGVVFRCIHKLFKTMYLSYGTTNNKIDRMRWKETHALHAIWHSPATLTCLSAAAVGRPCSSSSLPRWLMAYIICRRPKRRRPTVDNDSDELYTITSMIRERRRCDPCLSTPGLSELTTAQARQRHFRALLEQLSIGTSY